MVLPAGSVSLTPTVTICAVFVPSTKKRLGVELASLENAMAGAEFTGANASASDVVPPGVIENW
jgi:hypothetical protein